MDAVKFLKTKNRICKMYDNCFECPLGNVSTVDRGYQADCLANKMPNEEEAIARVEKWVEEHPVKTRQSEFLEMFPDAEVGTNGVLKIFPCWIDGKKRDGCYKRPCVNCTRDYWLAEVE